MSKNENSVEKIISIFGDLLDSPLPSVTDIWEVAQAKLNSGDLKEANKCYQLNHLLHNSHVPNSSKIGKGVKFAYGGIGLIIHNDCEIRDYAVIGSNVTIGGRARSKYRISEDGKRVYVPLIDKYAYVATGAVILGGVTIGSMSIVGANAVVIQDVPHLSIVAGSPSKIIGKITVDNCLSYKSTFSIFRNVSDGAYVDIVKSIEQSKSL
uniref:serine O-acetyltransferase n=1 Tax=Marinobacterium profundum TaxID=1714300 RepID=UPI0009E8B892|nr:hypothetical protein [Marinobacterium profundum]